MPTCNECGADGLTCPGHPVPKPSEQTHVPGDGKHLCGSLHYSEDRPCECGSTHLHTMCAECDAVMMS